MYAEQFCEFLLINHTGLCYSIYIFGCRHKIPSLVNRWCRQSLVSTLMPHTFCFTLASKSSYTLAGPSGPQGCEGASHAQVGLNTLHACTYTAYGRDSRTIYVSAKYMHDWLAMLIRPACQPSACEPWTQGSKQTLSS